MTGVLIKTENLERDTHTQEERHVKTEAETGVILLQSHGTPKTANQQATQS